MSVSGVRSNRGKGKMETSCEVFILRPESETGSTSLQGHGASVDLWCLSWGPGRQEGADRV